MTNKRIILFLHLVITATAFFAKIIIVDIVFLVAAIAYTFTIFSHFTVAKGTNSRIAGKTLQQGTKATM